MTREEALELLENLVAWAQTEGFDPAKDYTEQFTKKPGYLSENFELKEFACNCCGRTHENGVPAELVNFLENIRAHFGGIPVNINSGYRCPAHNQSVGGASASRHMEGDAADFWIDGVPPSQVYDYCDKLISNGGVGRYNTFTHIDVRGYKARW